MIGCNAPDCNSCAWTVKSRDIAKMMTQSIGFEKNLAPSPFDVLSTRSSVLEDREFVAISPSQHRTLSLAFDIIAVFLFGWMPTSPPSSRYKEEQEGGNESSSLSKYPPSPDPPSSSNHLEKGSEQKKKSTMVLMSSSGGARLMPPTVSRFTGEGQTEQKNDQPPAQSLRAFSTRPTEFVNDAQKMSHGLHVDHSSDLLQKHLGNENDISSHGTKTTTATTGTLGQHHFTSDVQDTDSDKKENEDKVETITSHPAGESGETESQTPSTSVSAGLQQQQRGPLSAEIVHRSIQGAVASVAAAARPMEESQETADEEGLDNSKMSAGNSEPDKKPRRKRKPQSKAGQSTGRWTVAEHRAFLEGLRECGREWKKVALRIPTRTSAQIRSHAQKYFSKLQRDHESMVNHSDASHAGGGTTETQQMQPSVQRSAQRILSNPHAAQREVENTLEALRERYRQLQLRLEQRQRLRANNNRSRVVEDDSTNTTNASRKRSLEESEVCNDHRSASSMDDQSSVSSMVSASAASIASRDLGNEELIALSVLAGDDLARRDASVDGITQLAPGSRRSPESSDNSSDSDDGNTASKKSRKEA